MFYTESRVSAPDLEPHTAAMEWYIMNSTGVRSLATNFVTKVSDSHYLVSDDCAGRIAFFPGINLGAHTNSIGGISRYCEAGSSDLVTNVY